MFLKIQFTFHRREISDSQVISFTVKTVRLTSSEAAVAHVCPHDLKCINMNQTIQQISEG